MASPRGLPPLCRRNVLWWIQTHGFNRDAVQLSKSASSDPDAFYCAIRDNRVDQVLRFVAENPAAVFTKRVLPSGKVFGNNQRTALYVASFFGRHQIVRALLHRGADKNVQCDGARAVDVAGFGSADPVDRMKVRALLQGDVCPQVIIRLDDGAGSSIVGGSASEIRRYRLQIHFSEAVDEFTREDVDTSDGCEVVAFSMLRRDLYVATVQLVRDRASVEIPAGVARAAGGRCNARSRPFQL